MVDVEGVAGVMSVCEECAGGGIAESAAEVDGSGWRGGRNGEYSSHTGS